MQFIFKTIVGSLIVLSLCNSCQPKNEAVLELETYAKEHLNKDSVTTPHLYFFLPADTCSGIVRALIPYINSLEDEERLTIILIGRSKRELDFLSADIKNRVLIAYDTGGEAFNRKFAVPTTVSIYKTFSDQRVEVENYSGSEIQEIPKSISSFLVRDDQST